MKKFKSLITLKVFLIITLFCLISAVAMPKYFDLNNKNNANMCKANQIIVETALAVAYADNLARGVDCYPEKLTASMFADGKIPTCPLDGTPIQFDKKTGKAHCPNHVHSHTRTAD